MPEPARISAPPAIRLSARESDVSGVVVVSATGAQNLLSWYSSYGTVDVAAPGGSRFQTPTFDSTRGRVLSSPDRTIRMACW